MEWEFDAALTGNQPATIMIPVPVLSFVGFESAMQGGLGPDLTEAIESADWRKVGVMLAVATQIARAAIDRAIYLSDHTVAPRPQNGSGPGPLPTDRPS